MLNDAKHGEISKKLDMIIKILAGIMLRDMALSDKISVLKELGFERKEIAELCGTTPATVTTYLYQQKKQNKKRKGA